MSYSDLFSPRLLIRVMFFAIIVVDHLFWVAKWLIEKTMAEPEEDEYEEDMDEENLEEENDGSYNNTSYDRWMDKSHDENAVVYKCQNARALINKCPTETWVDCMKFLNRDSLQTMQLVSNRFDLIVEKYFGIYPLRRIDWCKVKTTPRSKSMKALLICLGTGKTIETNSDLHLWLQNSMVECIEFIDFKFCFEFLRDLCNMNPKTIRINFAVFDYRRKAAVTPISNDQITSLFSFNAFQKCTGALFSFGPRCAAFRPKISDLLKLPQRTMVIDFEEYEATIPDNLAISSWLNGIQEGAPQPSSSAKRSKCEIKELSIKGIDYDDENIQNLLEELRKDFTESTRKQPYILSIEYEDWWGEHEQQTENTATGEKLALEVLEHKMVIRRV